MTTNQNFKIQQGTDKTIPLVLRDEDGDALDLTDCYLKWSLKDHVNGTTLSKDTVLGGIVIDVDPTTGHAQLILEKADTQGMTPAVYEHELRYRNAALNEDILFDGYCTVEESITL